MIAQASLQRTRPIPYRNVLPAVVPQPQPQPPPTPRDTASITSDDIRRVALLPAVDPAIGSVMIMASITLGMSGSAAGGASVTPSLVATLGERQAQIQYTLDDAGMTSRGILRSPTGTSAIDERLQSAGSAIAKLSGHIGDDAEDLVLTAGERGIEVKGSIGKVDVQLNFTLPTDNALLLGQLPQDSGDGSLHWAQVDGTIGGTPYTAVASLTAGNDDDLGSIQVQGSLGDQPITKSYQVTTDAASASLTIDGGGHVASQAQSMRLIVDFS